MKKNIPYIVLAAIVFIIIIGKKKSSIIPPGGGNGQDTLVTNHYLPPDDSEDNQKVHVNTCIYMENSGSMDGYVNLNSEFKDALGKIIVKSHNYSSSTGSVAIVRG